MQLLYNVYVKFLQESLHNTKYVDKHVFEDLGFTFNLRLTKITTSRSSCKQKKSAANLNKLPRK